MNFPCRYNCHEIIYKTNDFVCDSNTINYDTITLILFQNCKVPNMNKLLIEKFSFAQEVEKLRPFIRMHSTIL